MSLIKKHLFEAKLLTDRIFLNVKIEAKKSRVETDWIAEMKEDEFVTTKTGERLVKLAGLIRCANLAGKVGEHVEFPKTFLIPVKSGYNIFVQAVAHVNFTDGTCHVGSADCHLGNCAELGNYPTAVAESRAYARAIRKALGIGVLAYEEISEESDVSLMTDKISSEQKKAIELLMNKKSIPFKDLLEGVTARDNVLSLDDLTYEEAIRATRFLNSKKKKK